MQNSDDLAKLCYSVSEVSQMLGVTNKTVYRLLKRGLLKAPEALRHKRITAASLEGFIK